VKLILALLAAWPAAAAEGDIESLLAEAQKQLAPLEELAGLAGSDAASAPTAWMPADAAAAYCAASPMTVASLPPRDRELIYACSAYVNRDPGVCQKMPAAYISRSPENCTTSLENMALFIAVATPSPETLRICERGFAINNPKLPPQDRGKACAALAGPGDEDARCRALRRDVPRAFVGAAHVDCMDDINLVMTGKGCEGFHPGANQHVVCSAFAKFRKARRGDPAACRSDFLCSALRGDAGSCERERARRVASACSRIKTAAPPGAAAVPRALRDRIVDMIAWGAHLPILDQDGLDALSRLHEMMLGNLAVEPKKALHDLLRLRTSGIDDVLYRAEQLSAADENAAQARQAKKLRRQFEKTRSRILASLD
jgi:hypothetical protein